MTIHYKDAAPGAVSIIEESEEHEGIFTGYAAVFGNIDSVGDRVMPGAFAETLAKDYPAGGAGIPCYWGHRLDDPEMVIGETLAAVEDERGLKVTVQLDLENPKAAKAYDLIRRKLVNQMSFAYVIEDCTENADDKCTDLTKLRLFEVSLVQIGANTETELTDVKAFKAGRKISSSNLETLKRALELLESVIDDAEPDVESSGKDHPKPNPEEPETAKGKEAPDDTPRTLTAEELAEYKAYFA